LPPTLREDATINTRLDLDLARIARLPAGDDTWQLGVVRMPRWVVPDDGTDPYRPLVALARSAATGLVGFGDAIEPGQARERAAMAALGSLAGTRGIHERPARVEMDDPDVTEHMRPLLAGIGVETDLMSHLELLDEVIEDMAHSMTGDVPALYAGDSQDVERLRAFAGAAAAWHRTALWRHLSDEDLLHVEAGVPNENMRCCVVLGQGRIQHGLGFHSSREDHSLMMAGTSRDDPGMAAERWSLSFGGPHELAIADTDLWEACGLALAGPTAYPVLFGAARRRRMLRAGPEELTYVEGLLRALTGVTEAEIDSGRWSRTVSTFDGERTLTLSIPALADPAEGLPPGGGFPDRRLMERTTRSIARLVREKGVGDPEEINALLEGLRGADLRQSTATTPEDEAMDLVYEALERRGRARIKLARQALAVWSDCADAYVLLAESAPDAAQVRAIYEQGVAAGERALGTEAFTRDAGHFWGILETRPYMRARMGLAHCLWAEGAREEAVGHMQELLRLNPNDNQAVRFMLAPRLLELGRDEDAARVLEAYDDDPSAMLVYARALLAFRREGESENARRALGRAVRANAHVPKYLLGSARLPESPPHYRLGSDDEAVIVAEEQLPAWSTTPGALEWLRGQKRRARKDRQAKRKPGRGGRR
jgi:tetratricopeptide (TPR) repeat protein